MVEQAIAGLATINSWTTNSHTLTTANGTTSESRCAMLVLDDDGAGNPSAAATVICPAETKIYIVKNICGQTATIKTAAGTGVAIPNNNTAIVFCDGTNVVEGSTYASTVNIDGGTIDNTVIGGTTAAAGSFTTLSTSSTTTISALTASQAVFTNASKQLVSNAITGTGSVVMSASPTLTGTLTAAAITASGTVTGNGNWVIGNADTDTVTIGASFVTGSVLRSAKADTNTLALAAYDVDGAAYTNLITLTASNTPTLTLTSTGVGTINNMSIGATTASTGAFTTLSASSTVSGAGFSTYLASPPAIGGTTPAAGSFTTLSANSTVTISGLTASQAVFTNASSQLVSNAITGTGNVVMSASPTLTGTITAAAITASGTVTLNGALAANGGVTLGDASGDALTIGSNTATINNTLTFAYEDATTNTVVDTVRVRRTSSGVPALGIGAGFAFEVETAASNVETGATLDVVTTDVTAASEDFDFVVNLMTNGAAAAEKFRVTSAGEIKSTSATFTGAMSAGSLAGTAATGSGASGTWGISITGDAASVDGKSFGTFSAAGGVLYATSTTAASGTAAGTSGQPLLSGAAGAPTWGTLGAGAGGTGQTTYAVGDILYASASTTLSKLADVATGNALVSGGVNTAPSWGKIGLTTHVSGTLPIANGGTNSTATPTDGGIAFGNGTSFAFTAAGTSGQFLKSDGANDPGWATLQMTDIPDAAFKRSVKAATTANITLSAPQTIDGISVVAGDRVLVKNQTAPAENGIYVVAAGAWTRATDADAASEIGAAVVAVDSGTANGGELWTTNFKTTDTLGTTAMNWYEVLYNTGTWGISVTGSAGSAATLTTSRSLWGQSFNGSADITAPLLPAAGAVGAPAFSTSGDTNTGMYFPSADNLAFSTGGTLRLQVNNGSVDVKNQLLRSGNLSLIAWTTSGSAFDSAAATYTDTTTAAAGVVASRAVNTFNTPTLASSNAITVTTAATVYISAAPTAGTNTTITTPYALWVDSGNSQFDGDATVNGTLNVRTAIDLADNDILRFGDADDWELFHDGTNNYMDLNVGNLIIRDNTTTRITIARTTGDVTTTGVFWPQAGSSTFPAFSTSGDTNTGMHFPAADQIAFSTGGSEKVRIIDTGNVGIGTSAPAAKLEVARTDAADGIRVTVGQGAYSGNVALFGVTGQSNGYYITKDTANNIQHIWDGTGGAERMRIDSAGKVGIGAAPNANAQLNVLGTLRVEGSGVLDTSLTIGEGRSGNGYAYIDLIGDTTYTDYGVRIIRQNTGPNTGSEVAARGTGAFTINCVDAGTMVFATSNTERARITSAGQFLVRTTGVGTNAAMQVAAYNSTSFCLALENHQSTTFGGMGISLNNDATAIAFYKSWSGVGNITITSTSTAYNTSSDYRLKNIEGELTDSGSYIDALRPVQGTWKADGSKFIGLIAHEVQEVSQTKVVTGAKDEVDENGKPVYQGLDYSSAEIIANLIAEVQSLRKRVAQLEQGA